MSGQRRTRDKEDLVSKAIVLGTPNTRNNRRKLRKAIKDAIKPSAELVQNYAETFLIGKPLPFNFGEFMELVRRTAVNDQAFIKERHKVPKLHPINRRRR